MKCKRAIIDLSATQDPIRPMPTSVAVLNKDCLCFNSSDIDKDPPRFFSGATQFPLMKDQRRCAYIAYKRIHLSYLLCKLYRSLRTINRSPSGHHITAGLGLPDAKYRGNADSGYFNAMDNIHSELYGLVDHLYRGIRAVERFAWDYGSVPGLYGFREALQDQSMDEDYNPAIAFMFGKSTATYFDDDAMKSLVEELSKSIFPLDVLLEVEKCYTCSLIELTMICAQGFSDAIYDKTLEILYSRGLDASSDIGIACIKSLKAHYQEIVISTQNLSIMKQISANFLRLNDVRGSLLRMCNALIDSINKPILQRVFNSESSQLEYAKLEPSLESTDFGSTLIMQYYPLVSNKIKILVKVLQKPPRSSSATDTANRSIVFCETRLSAAAISNLLSDFVSSESISRLSSPDVDSASRKLKSSCSLTGTLSYSIQNTVLKNFKLGEALVLVATNVAEEGIDVQTCSLVINLEIPHTFNSFIQRRGRARSIGSYTVSIIDANKVGHDDLRSLLKFEAEESRMMDDFKQAFSEGDDEDDVLSKKAKKEQVETYCVLSSGASVDTNSAVALLYSLFQQIDIRRDQYYETRPISVTQRINEYPPLFRCSILLPGHIPSHLRCIVGADRSSKAWAEGSTALECIKQLHIAGILDDQFNINEEVIYGAKKIDIPNGMGSASSLTQDKLASIKIVPDLMVVNMNPNPSLTTLYIYHFRVDLPDDHHESCIICQMRMDGIRDASLAYARPLPEDLLNLSFPTTIEGCAGPQLRIQYLGKKNVTIDVLNILYRYHRAVACWATSSLDESYCLAPQEFLQEHVDNVAGIDPSIWANSSHGVWYVAYPHSAFHITEEESLKLHLSTCATDAEILVHNLWILEKLKRSADLSITSKSNAPSSWLRTLDSHQLPGYLVTKGRSQISLVVACDSDSSTASRNLHLHWISSRLSLLPLFMHCAEPSSSYHKESHLNVYSTPEENFTVLGHGKWYFLGLMLPSLAWRIQSLLLAIELRDFLKNRIRAHDPSCEVISNELPSADAMLEALTPRRCQELIQFERIEFLGDSFLKFITSVELYHLHPHKHEGYLSYQREQYISNKFLAATCQRWKLLQYLRAFPLSVGKSELRVSPPGMIANDKSLWNQHVVTRDTVHVTDEQLAARAVDNPGPVSGCRLSPADLSGSQYVDVSNIRAKEPADLLEAIIGAYFLAYGVPGARALVDALAILPEKPVTASHHDHEELLNIPDISITFPEGFADELKELVNSSSVSYNAKGSSSEEGESNNYSQLEARIGYRFHNREILQEAMTHTSLSSVIHNQRLEFFGDAVLDFAIVQTMYRDKALEDEGKLTRKKESAANNHRLCLAAIDIGLHHHLRAREPLRSELRNLDSLLSAHSYEIKADDGLVKPLADAFEALIGAIFLDCQQDFQPIFHLITLCQLLEHRERRQEPASEI
jgi:dsRNA-specific ribonuclease